MRDLQSLSSAGEPRVPRRVSNPPQWGATARSRGGRFYVASCVDRQDMVVIATVGDDWEHVSVSRPKRTPHWAEMEQVKRTFFMPDETAMQLHVPAEDHVNHHPFCLHLWRPVGIEIPRPPAEYVGPAGPPRMP